MLLGVLVQLINLYFMKELSREGEKLLFELQHCNAGGVLFFGSAWNIFKLDYRFQFGGCDDCDLLCFAWAAVGKE